MLWSVLDRDSLNLIKADLVGGAVAELADAGDSWVAIRCTSADVDDFETMRLHPVRCRGGARRRPVASGAIVDSRMFIRSDLDHPFKTTSFFQASGLNQGHVANQLLLYNKIVMPTSDCAILPILINWFGLSAFENLLDSGAVTFVRRRGSIGYCGNGLGLCIFNVTSSPVETSVDGMEWWQQAICGTEETAVEQQLRNMCPFLESKRRNRLIEKVMPLVSTLDLDHTQSPTLAHETYTDVMSSPVLARMVFQATGQQDFRLDLPRLPGIEANQVRVLGLTGLKDGIDVLLRLAEMNAELMIGSMAEDADILTSPGVDDLLRSKLARQRVAPDRVAAFTSLLSLNNLPDIGSAVAAGHLQLRDIVALRSREAAVGFREWLSQGRTFDPVEVQRRFVEAIGGSKKWGGLPLRSLRFAVVTALGLLGPISGLVTGLVDSFFLDRWLAGYSPKLFFDELQSLVVGQGTWATEQYKPDAGYWS